jgi:hypothetical protein
VFNKNATHLAMPTSVYSDGILPFGFSRQLQTGNPTRQEKIDLIE